MENTTYTRQLDWAANRRTYTWQAPTANAIAARKARSYANKIWTVCHHLDAAVATLNKAHTHPGATAADVTRTRATADALAPKSRLLNKAALAHAREANRIENISA